MLSPGDYLHKFSATTHVVLVLNSWQTMASLTTINMRPRSYLCIGPHNDTMTNWWGFPRQFGVKASARLRIPDLNPRERLAKHV